MNHKTSRCLNMVLCVRSDGCYVLSVVVVVMTTANVEIGNTLQEVTNPMERTQNIAHLEKPTLLNSSGEITNYVLKLDQIILHFIRRRLVRFDTVW
jgi:hypothetical protein